MGRLPRANPLIRPPLEFMPPASSPLSKLVPPYCGWTAHCVRVRHTICTRSSLPHTAPCQDHDAGLLTLQGDLGSADSGSFVLWCTSTILTVDSGVVDARNLELRWMAGYRTGCWQKREEMILEIR